MKIALTPSWELQTTRDGVPVLINRHDQRQYNASDIVSLYPSWSPQPASQAVRRATKLSARTPEEKSIIRKFCGEKPKAKQGQIQLRVDMDTKNRFVKAAQAKGSNLSGWILNTCEEALKNDQA